MLNLQVLKNVPLFSAMSDEDLRLLRPSIQQRSYPRNATIMRAGEETAALYVVLSGRVKVLIPDENGREVILATLNEAPAGKLNHEMFQAGSQQFKGQFDAEYGGFGGAPKFPRPVSFNFLLREYRRSGDAEALEMVIRTLMQMEKGGVFVHIGGGFHRYSVERFWRMPHFEKMLYDQAQIASSFIDAYLLTKDEYFSGVAKSILDYVLRKLTSPEGGFYSAEDADSEGYEGKFYCCTQSELRELLSPAEFEVAIRYFGIVGDGNFVDHASPWPAATISSPCNSTIRRFAPSPDAGGRPLSTAMHK